MFHTLTLLVFAGCETKVSEEIDYGNAEQEAEVQVVLQGVSFD